MRLGNNLRCRSADYCFCCQDSFHILPFLQQRPNEALPHIPPPLPFSLAPPLWHPPCTPSPAPHLFLPFPCFPGRSLVCLFVRTEQTTRELRNLEEASPAVRLLADYMARFDSDMDMNTRMKVRNKARGTYTKTQITALTCSCVWLARTNHTKHVFVPLSMPCRTFHGYLILRHCPFLCIFCCRS